MTVRAFSLTEVVIALGVVAFCLVALIGLLPASLRIQQSATQSTAAINLISGIAADLRLARTNLPSPVYSIQLPAPAGQAVTNRFFIDGAGRRSDQLVDQSGLGGSRYRVQIVIEPPVDSHFLPSTAWILVTWPPAATQNPAGHAEVATRF
ncbi:MAG: hypothetical protein SFU53_05850 [Terrimicrobiaceae bacterium]|nr:hypothetical protein [Terrimicrobiaceae bacterium]